jgi:hypothetical protein
MNCKLLPTKSASQTVGFIKKGTERKIIERKQKPIPYDDWPIGFRILARIAAKPEDKGMGDLIERMIGPIGGGKFKIWHKRVTGKDCSCGTRKQKLNELHPFEANKPIKTGQI